MRDRAKIIIAGIVATAALAVTLVVTLIPKRHVVEFDGIGPISGEDADPAATLAAMQQSLAEAERQRADAISAGVKPESLSDVDRELAKMRTAVEDYRRKHGL